MKNEYGVTLDRNGYAPSLWPHAGCCDICGRTDRPLQRHEVYPGAYRAKSKALGCWMHLCDLCHAVVSRKGNIKARMQQLAMEAYGWSVDDFRERFGKNYMEDL